MNNYDVNSKAGVIVQGNSSGAKSSESTLLSGSGNDVIFAGSGDIIDASAGANTIFLTTETSLTADRIFTIATACELQARKVKIFS